MAPRTRATATISSAPANLAAAPRRRVRITPLDKEDTKSTKTEELVKPATRATRSKATTTTTQDEPLAKTLKTAATKTKRRPKKSDTIEENEPIQPVERLAEKPKRATRSTRATATTVSSEAKEKPVTKTTRTAKPTTRTTRAASIASEQQEQPVIDEPAPAARVVSKKKVTFQDIEDDKENQPVTRATKKTGTTKATKSASTAASLKAKPVRKPVASTRASKRTKDNVSDDEAEQKPKKIQRILTPKKITQVSRPLTPDEASEDELSGGKTPVRDLSMSPKRPQTSAVVEAVTKALSPAKKINFSQSIVQQAVKQGADSESNGALASPARRPPTSPAKLFSQSMLGSTTKIFKDEPTNHLASPARRPIMSPIKEGEEASSRALFGNASKLLFPNANKTSQISVNSTQSNLLQSPKRSIMFDPARIFAQSAVKPSTTNLHKSSFFSSPAKRIGTFSPLKKTTTPDAAVKGAQLNFESPELELNDIEITNFMNDGTVETTVTSHQRNSMSPLRTYRITQDEENVDFDDSVLEIRSPLKISRSPIKALVAPQSKSVILQDVQNDEDETELLSSAQSTPHVSHIDTNFVSLQAMDAEEGTKLKDSAPDLTMINVNDDTIDLADFVAEGTPRAPVAQNDRHISLDELAPSPQEDVVAKYLRTPGTPATIHEHELTNTISEESPSVQQDVAEPVEMEATPRPTKAVVVKASPASVHEHELTLMAGTPATQHVSASSSPASLDEHELTDMLSSPALLNEHELTQMISPAKPRRVIAEQSPASIHEHELTNMLSSPMLGEKSDDQPSPGSLHEHELTNMMSSPRKGVIAKTDSPVSLHEHELTRMLSSPHLDLAATPNLPIPRKFNCNTVVTKVPLKPEGQESPFKLAVTKRKRPLSLGGQPDFLDIIQRPAKSPRTSLLPEAAVSEAETETEIIATPASVRVAKTPSSKASTIKSTRRVASTPNPTRTPLTPVVNGVLTGAVVYVDVRTSEGADASAIYIQLLSGLGAKVVSSIGDASLLTHIVFKDGNPKTLDKIRRASIGDGINAKIVGVSWPLDCDAKREWVDEEAYLLNLNSTDHVVSSIGRSAKRKSMEPSMLITDGSGSVKRSRSKGRASMRRSSIKPLLDVTNTSTPSGRSSINFAGSEDSLATPTVNTAKKQADLEKNSLTAAWKSINATQNLGEDTPARRTLELLQKTYELERDDWDSTILSATDTNVDADGNTPRPSTTTLDLKDKDLLETGLTPAPYRTQQQTLGSAPAKHRDIGLMSYRERVEEMERREMRDNALGVEGGRGRGIRGKGKRVTMFGEDFGSRV